MNQFSQETRHCIQECLRCHAVCLATAMTECLEMGGEHVRPQHFRLMLDCAAFCAFTADALARKSQFHNRFAELCAQVCDTCAQDCEKIGDMQECVEACRHCVEVCTALARLEHAAILAAASRLSPG